MEEVIKALHELAAKVLEAENEPFAFMKPDTLEWFVFKTSFLEPDDLEGVEEWVDYLVEKAAKKGIKDMLAGTRFEKSVV